MYQRMDAGIWERDMLGCVCVSLGVYGLLCARRSLIVIPREPVTMQKQKTKQIRQFLYLYLIPFALLPKSARGRGCHLYKRNTEEENNGNVVFK